MSVSPDVTPPSTSTDSQLEHRDVEGGALELESESEFESEALGLAGLRVPSVSESKSAVSEHPQLKTTTSNDLAPH